MAEYNVTHQLTITERKKIHLNGVIQVDSFDDDQVILETKLGGLVVKGHNMHVNQLDVQAGNLTIEGLITGLEYYDESRSLKGKGKGFWQRLMK